MDERDLKFTTSGIVDITEYKVEKVDWNESVKNKANQLMQKFSNKEIVLNCIDEIIIALEHTDDCVVNIIEIPEFDSATAFYEDVKKEIENL